MDTTSDFQVFSELSSGSYYKTVVCSKGEVRLAAAPVDEAELRRKVEAGTPLDEASTWARTLNEDSIYWVRMDENGDCLDIAYKGPVGQTLARLQFSDPGARDRLFAILEDQLSGRFSPARKQYGLIRTIWVQLLVAALALVFGIDMAVNSGHLVDRLNLEKPVMKGVYYPYKFADDIGPIGVIAVFAVILIICGMWAYRMAQHPPTMRYLNKNAK